MPEPDFPHRQLPPASACWPDACLHCRAPRLLRLLAAVLLRKLKRSLRRVLATPTLPGWIVSMPG